ncbi:serine/threonine specific protein phosphatase [Rhizoctonia solani AG-1 IA]|uniref:Serine/threonine-protein phosphatase n=1 Tax=Thanatephorus cucumeris (strain AG1-IA) TaxID=983506 RepID=L8WTY2_THACA|nr:serine/threonine specific protein phosphatase [Rhizoctonia solani AG-1 IA]
MAGDFGTLESLNRTLGDPSNESTPDETHWYCGHVWDRSSVHNSGFMAARHICARTEKAVQIHWKQYHQSDDFSVTCPECNNHTFRTLPPMHPDQWLPHLMKCQHLPEADITALCNRVRAILIEEGNIQPIASPVTICGDIHGQFWDLLELLRKGGMVPDTKYIFMGDFVDRGNYSLETVSLLLALKARWSFSSRNNQLVELTLLECVPRYPDKVTLLRGNHESHAISNPYADECQQKYGSSSVWKACCTTFDYLNLAAVRIIDGEVLCVHGGLSPDIRTLDQIRVLTRAQEIPHEGAFYLMWSDPDDIPAWAVSPRGAGWLFGGNVTREFNHVNGLKLIARAHQLVQEGHKYMFNTSLVTVWSAPNYCYRYGVILNKNAALLTVTVDVVIWPLSCDSTRTEQEISLTTALHLRMNAIGECRYDE